MPPYSVPLDLLLLAVVNEVVAVVVVVAAAAALLLLLIEARILICERLAVGVFNAVVIVVDRVFVLLEFKFDAL
jgi:hypothetical protein